MTQFEGSGSGGNEAFNRRAIPATASEGFWHAADGHALRRIDWPAAAGGVCRGSLLFLPGRGDCFEKYLESFDHWHGQGWNVTAIDWRGQAGSGREGLDGLTGHIADFAIWVADLERFWGEWVAATPGPHVLVAHSMGGQLALRALAEKRVTPRALVLTAPMLGLSTYGLPLALVQRGVRLLAGLGDRRRPAWQSAEKPGAVPDERIHLLTHDVDRYADEQWWRQQRPYLLMGAPSWGWLDAALGSIRLLGKAGVLEAVTTPVLLFGTSADRLVDPRAITRAARRLPHGELVMFGSEAAHEVLREADGVRLAVWSAIDAFLDRNAPAESRPA